MEMEDHFKCAEVYLEMSNEKVSRRDYIGARDSLAQAYSHTRELLDHVLKLEVSKANLEVETEDEH